MSDKKFKQSIIVEGDITSTGLEANRALITDANKKIIESAVTSTELGYVSGVTSSIQTQLNTNSTAINDHLSDASDAHDASAISNVPSGNLVATDVQAALNELQSDVDSRIPSSEKGSTNGVATLDGSGKVPVSQLPSAVMTYEGVWNAFTNSPTLADGVGNAGMVYRVGTAGTQNLGSGNISFEVGDYVIYNGTVWEKSDTTDAVASVFGRTGIVTAQSGDYTATQITNTPAGNIAATTVQAAINELDSEKFASADFNSTFDTRLATKSTTNLTEGTNLYFTDERAQDAVGNNLLDTASVDLTYNDGTGQISATVLPAGVDHDALQNFVANEHVDHSLVQIATGANSGLTGGGNLTATRNLSVNITGTTALSAAPDNADELLVHDTSANSLVKVTVAELLSSVVVGSPGDIEETSFSLANNQTTPANVTGLAFANGVVRSFEALVSVQIDAASDLFEVFKLYGIRRGADWQMSVESTGDDSLVAFTITSSGQVQYTSGNFSGFVTGLVKFRALTTSI